jgi:hypothetical protein
MAAPDRRMAKESANRGSPELRINVTKAWDEKKPATFPGGLFSA